MKDISKRVQDNEVQLSEFEKAFEKKDAMLNKRAKENMELINILKEQDHAIRTLVDHYDSIYNITQVNNIKCKYPQIIVKFKQEYNINTNIKIANINNNMNNFDNEEINQNDYNISSN